MEEAAFAGRYWCHMCSLTVNPVMDDEIKCPLCRSGFVEEMQGEQVESPDTNDQGANTSIWAPILMEMMHNSSRRASNQNLNEAETENETGNPGGTDLDSQLREILRRRGRGSVSVVQLLQGVRAGLTLAPESNGGDDDNNNPGRERGRVIVINPHNQIVAVPSSVVADSLPAAASLSEYFIGPGFEALLQRLAETDPNRYGTPPAQKDAVEALASVKIQEALQCSVCLDDFEIGTVAKQMPCKHSFHGDCLLPWLELHSSCPVCRYQLPGDDTKTESVTTEANGNNEGGESSARSSQGSENSDGNRHEEEEDEEEVENDDVSRSTFSIPWPLSALFSSSQGSSDPSRGTN